MSDIQSTVGQLKQSSRDSITLLKAASEARQDISKANAVESIGKAGSQVAEQIAR